MAVKTVSPQDELERLIKSAGMEYQRRFLRLLPLLIGDGAPRPGWDASPQFTALAQLLGQTAAMAEMLGRRRMVLNANRLKRARPNQPEPEFLILFADKIQPELSKVRFKEAIADLVNRTPQLAKGWKEVQERFLKADPNSPPFLLARNSGRQMIERVQQEIAQIMKDGAGSSQAAEILLSNRDNRDRVAGWTRAYAENVYRTNASSAFTRGLREQVKDPDVAEIIGAFEFETAEDDDVRANHAAAHGFLAPITDPEWNRIAPPLGHQCRCSLLEVDRFELKRRGLLKNGKVERVVPRGFAAAGPDPGFRGGL